MVRYPRTSIVLLTAVAVVATLSIASRSSIDPRNTSPSTPRPTHSPLDDIYLPFDTLRTDPADYIWPTDASVLLTSGFGEFRRTHFHAGIDISTNNRTGYKVFASRDGFVSRVRVSPYGYGKMLSVRHADGYSTIYAHLQRFNDEIEDSVRQSQLRNQRYALDMEVEKDVFPVRKGEVIAYSGDTGVGAAHLHFEIRDERLHPVNPFLFPAFVDAVEDRTPPVFEALALTPLDYTSLVEGRHISHIAEARRISAREYRFASPLRLTGEIGVAVKAYDKANHPHYRNSIRRYRVLLDSLHVFTMNLDRFPADESKQIALFYDWSLLVERRGRFQKLYIDEGNRLPLYERLPHGSGVLRTSEHGEGSYELTIEATDAQGNTARLHGTVVLNHPPEIEVRRVEKKLLVNHSGGSAIAAVHVAKRNEEGGWTRERFPLANLSRDHESFEVPMRIGARDVIFVEAENAFGTRSAPVFFVPPTTTPKAPTLRVQHQRVRDFLIVTVSSSAPLTSTPILYAASGASSFTATMHQRDLTTATASVPLAVVDERDVELSVEATVGSFPVHAKELVRVVAITPERGGRIESDDGLFSAEFPPNAVYAPLYCWLEKTERGYALFPHDVLLNRGAAIKVLRADDKPDSSLGLYISDGGSLRFAATSGDGRVFRTHVARFLGEYALLPDATPPSITKLSVHATRTRLNLSFGLSDNRSGIDADRLVVRLNGEFLIAEYDPYRRRVHYEGRHTLPAGAHVLSIEAADRMGNTRQVVQTVRVR